MYKHIISLGEDCFMRSLIDRYNIRKKFKIRMPFDGSVHPYEEVCRLITTDFIDYTENIKYANNCFVNNNGVKWNHERTNNVESFIVQLKSRVEQFKTILNSNDRILFLIHHKNKDINFNFDLIINALSCKYPNLEYHIFVFNNFHENFYINRTNNTTYLNIFFNPNNITNYDNINYNNLDINFINQIYITKYGIDFSLKVLQEICNILQEDHLKYKLDRNYNFNSNLL
jgi:hypothetical protein